MSQFVTVLRSSSSLLTLISSVPIDKELASLRFRKDYVLKASFFFLKKNLLRMHKFPFNFLCRVIKG